MSNAKKVLNPFQVNIPFLHPLKWVNDKNLILKGIITMSPQPINDKWLNTHKKVKVNTNLDKKEKKFPTRSSYLIKFFFAERIQEMLLREMHITMNYGHRTLW